MTGDKWYLESEVYDLLKREKPLLLIHAAWLTEHLNRAFEKGRQIGRGEMEMTHEQQEREASIRATRNIEANAIDSNA